MVKYLRCRHRLERTRVTNGRTCNSSVRGSGGSILYVLCHKNVLCTKDDTKCAPVVPILHCSCVVAMTVYNSVPDCTVMVNIFTLFLDAECVPIVHILQNTTRY